MVGRVYVWTDRWLRAPEQVAGRDRDLVMKLYPLWGKQFVVHGDVESFTEVRFDEPPE
jgi:hypothetical protein